MEKGFILFRVILFRKRLRKDYFHSILNSVCTYDNID